MSRLLTLLKAPSGGWDPSQEIGGAAPYIWLTADRDVIDASDVLPDDAEAVKSWTDQVSGKVFTQGTAGNRPLYRSSGINSKPAIDGESSDRLVTSFSELAGVSGTVIIVCELDATSTSRQTLLAVEDASFNAITFVAHMGSAGDNMGFYCPGFVTNQRGSTALTTGTPYVMTWLKTDAAATIKMRLNGNAETVTTIGGSSNGRWFGNLTVTNAVTHSGLSFGSLPLTGKIRHIYVHPLELTGDDLAQVEQYFADDAGVTLS